MAYQTINVRSDDGDVIALKVEARDALIWEQTGRNNPSILSYLVEPSMIEMYRLAHIAMKRQHQYPGSLTEFQQAHDVFIHAAEDPEDDDQEPDPTEAAPSAESLSSSQSRPVSRPRSGQTRASKRSSPRSS